MTQTTSKPIAYQNAESLAAQIATKLIPDLMDAGRWNDLRLLLIAFAAEIKRSAIEP